MELTQDLIQTYIQKHPQAAARYLESLDAKEVHKILQTFDAEVIASAFEYYLPTQMAEVLEQFSLEQSAQIISGLSTTAARAVLRQFNAQTQTTLFSMLDDKIAPYLRRTLTFPDYTAANLADPRVFTLPPDITVGEAISRSGKECQKAMYYLFVIDHQSVLHGVVLMKELLAALPTQSIQSIMNQSVKMIPASAHAKDLISHQAWKLYDSLPVVDQGKFFMGVLRYRRLKKFLEGTTQEHKPEFLSDALLQLWEAYSLSGIGLLTTVGEVLHASRDQTRSQEEKEKP